MKAMVLGLGLAAVLAAVIGLSLALSSSGASVQAQEQASPAAPANVRAANVDTPGQAVVRWDAVADAAYYRIGWVNMETFQAVQAEGGREWLDVFAFQDVVNRGQTDQTLSDLEPGVQYAFIAASVGHRFGNAAGWSDWTYLTMAAAEVTSCPTDAGTTPDAPGGSGAPTPTRSLELRRRLPLPRRQRPRLHRLPSFRRLLPQRRPGLRLPAPARATGIMIRTKMG